jgi:hypothetical protein
MDLLVGVKFVQIGAKAVCWKDDQGGERKEQFEKEICVKYPVEF